MKRIAVVGASVRAAAESWERAGYETISCDLFLDRDLPRRESALRIENFPHDLPRLPATLEADAWVPAGGLENHPAIVREISRSIPLLGCSPEAMSRVRDRESLEAIVEQTGVNMPASHSERPADVDQWLIKRIASAGGLGIVHATKRKELLAGEYYQRKISGSAYSATFLGTVNGAIPLGISRQTQLADSFLYSGSIGPLRMPDHVHESLKTLASSLTFDAGVRGWFGLDFMLDDRETIWILEVNPRFTASIEVLERAADMSFAPLHMAACRGEPLETEPRFGTHVCGKRIIYAKRDLLISESMSDQWWERRTLQNEIADLPMPHERIAAGHPVLTLLADGTSEAAVSARLDHFAQELELRDLAACEV